MSNTTTTQSPRLLSLDALRGFDMFWIMSGEQIIHALAKATNWPIFIWMSNQLHHTVWNGFTFYDMIFPLFLFIAGVSMPYSLQKKMQQLGVESASQLPASEKRKIYASMLKRALTLIVLGFVVNGILKFNGLENTRFASVLGRIGTAWFFAGLIYMNFNLRGQLICLVAILLGYWAMMMWVPVPGFGAGVLTMEGSLESYIDRMLLPGRLHDKIHDPEGILSTIPAIGTALLGILTGSFLRLGEVKFSMNKKALVLLVAGLVLLAVGWAWGLVFPINKRIWTSSFVVYVAGWSLVLFSFFYFVIDVLKWKKWAFPFIVGSNSILIYLFSEGMVDFDQTANFIFGGLYNKADILWQPVFAAASVTFIQIMLLYFLYKNKLFFKV
jgi:predicted acyltransferase